MSEIIRSPFFYVGDKYKLMRAIKRFFPQTIQNYVEPFVGGGSSFLNVKATRYLLNDVDPFVVLLHQKISSYSNDKQRLFDELFALIERYRFSCSFKGITAPEELKRQFVKTYYARYNKEAYERLRDDFNVDRTNALLLYLLVVYGFNHMLRFNSSGRFNLPVGNVDFNKNVYLALNNYLDFVRPRKIEFHNDDYQKFLSKLTLTKDDFVYFDPPYLISSSEYNKLWNESEERRLYETLDELNSRGIKFAITNLLTHKGATNRLFERWITQYHAFKIKSNYISFNDNSVKKDSQEMLVCNYESNVSNPSVLDSLRKPSHTSTSALETPEKCYLFDVAMFRG